MFRLLPDEPRICKAILFDNYDEVLDYALSGGNLNLLTTHKYKIVIFKKRLSLLDLAILGESFKILDLLLYHKEINITLQRNNNYLSYACYTGNLQILKTLLIYHANIKNLTLNNIPLFMANHSKDAVVINLISRHFNLYSEGFTPGFILLNLYMLITADELPAFKTLMLNPLVKKQALKDNTLLYHTIAYHSYAIFNYLITLPEIINNIGADNNWALCLAVMYGDERMVRALLTFTDVSSNLTVHNSLPLQIASAGNNNTISILLLSYPAVLAKADIDNNLALHILVKKGNLQLIKLLMQNAKVCSKIHCGWNKALEIAIAYKHVEIVKYLLTFPRVRSQFTHPSAFNLLKLAARVGDATILGELLNIPAVKTNIHLQANIILKLAIYHKHLECIALLLALPNVQENIANDNIELFKNILLNFPNDDLMLPKNKLINLNIFTIAANTKCLEIVALLLMNSSIGLQFNLLTQEEKTVIKKALTISQDKKTDFILGTTLDNVLLIITSLDEINADKLSPLELVALYKTPTLHLNLPHIANQTKKIKASIIAIFNQEINKLIHAIKIATIKELPILFETAFAWTKKYLSVKPKHAYQYHYLLLLMLAAVYNISNRPQDAYRLYLQALGIPITDKNLALEEILKLALSLYQNNDDYNATLRLEKILSHCKYNNLNIKHKLLITQYIKRLLNLPEAKMTFKELLNLFCKYKYNLSLPINNYKAYFNNTNTLDKKYLITKYYDLYKKQIQPQQLQPNAYQPQKPCNLLKLSLHMHDRH